MKRYDIINTLITRYGYETYLEIGTGNRKWNFDRINCKHKYCIDPDPKADADFVGTSDEFFDNLPIKPESGLYDIIFIDGLHTSEQVYKDIINSIEILKRNGTIIVHDTMPKSRKAARPWSELQESNSRNITGIWNGDVYKGVLRAKNEFEKFSPWYPLFFTIDTDHGCSIFIDTEFDNFPISMLSHSINFEPMEFKEFKVVQKHIMNSITPDVFNELLYNNNINQ